MIIDAHGPQSAPGTLRINGITYFGSASTPADNSTNTTNPVAVTPPASMLAGDLVFMVAMVSATDRTIDISNNGGQSWSEQFGENNVFKMFWCRFDGTWDANPSVAISGAAQAKQAVMHVFRPTVGTNVWDVDQGPNLLTTTTNNSITGVTTAQKSSVAIGIWSFGGNTTYPTITGTGWTSLGSNQYRNTSSSSNTTAYAYKIMTRYAVNTSNVRKNTGAQSTRTAMITFYEH